MAEQLRHYSPKYTYYITDPASASVEPLEVFHGHLMDHGDFPKLIFRDDLGVMIGLHNLAPGHTVTAVYADGYSLQERPPEV